MTTRSGHERVLTLVKAQPHVGDRHGETVCCAGVTPNREWRRLYPVIYRRLDAEKQFDRWDWIEYDWRRPTTDTRSESRHIQEDTIKVLGAIKSAERASFLNPLVVRSTNEATSRQQSLCLLRPINTRFTWLAKSGSNLAIEREAYVRVNQQASLFEKEAPPTITPCPYAFKFEYKDEEGNPHTATCDDWETAAMYFNLRKGYGEEHALQHMDETFNEEYPAKGMVFAMGTVFTRPWQWLLVGVIRLDPSKQGSLF